MTSTDIAIPGYEDLSEVNRGGFATIYRAWQPTFERNVAIKVLAARADEATVRRFQRECAAIGALSGHPNIVTVYEAGTTDDGRLYIVMEFMAGGSLADRLAAQGRFPVGDVLDIGARVAGAIESAHRAGILHRDLKPENILLSRLGEPKVADFGLAELAGAHAGDSAGLTGTIVHSAPEVLSGDGPTVATDIYSLASTLFSLLDGKPPFALSGTTSLATVLAHITGDPPRDLRGRDVPAELCDVLEQGLAKAAADRQRDVAQMGRQLQAVQAGLGQPITRLPIESAEPPPPLMPLAPGRAAHRRGRVRGRRGRLVAAAVLGVAAVVAGVLPLTRNHATALPDLYRDNFDAGQNWYEHDDDKGRQAYEEGRYRITAKGMHQVVLSDTSFRGGVYGEPLTNLGDVSVQVRAQPVVPGTIFGLFCRYGARDWYQAAVRTDGEALITKLQSGELKKLAGAAVPGLSVGSQVTLQLDCRGGSTTHITLSADGTKVAAATDRDNPVRAGSVGMMASTDGVTGDVFFEDFVLKGRRLPD